jgi:pyruvate/2-oxoglutarate dehydrogenase complex dihydrolipoamide dehydrogenase (E3) component
MKYDAIVIGSGQAGLPLSFRLADIGWQVALVERSFLGGTCINNGCSPTKTMVHRAQVAYYARNAKRWGVRATNVSADLRAIVDQKNKVVHSFRGGKEKQMRKRPSLHFYGGHARFVDAHRIEVGDTVLESEKIFINTGGRSRDPHIAGLETVPYLTSENIMDLTAVPEHLIVLGGGYIGLEFAQMFARFGSRVTVIHNSGQIVSREDPEVAAELQRALEAEDITFLLSARATGVEKNGDRIVVSVNRSGSPVVVSGSHLLVAVGRRPNTDDLGLEKS